MISTVTTSTITSITTVAAMGLAAGISLAAVVTLIAFLATRHLASASSSTSSQLTSRFLTIGILPMMMAFVATVVVKIVEILA